MVDLVWFQLLSAALFVIGLYGVMARRSAVPIEIGEAAGALHVRGGGDEVDVHRVQHQLDGHHD